MTETDPKTHWHEDLILPTLLAEARRAYGKEIRRRLAEAGFDDVPRAGSRVLGAISRHGGHVRDIAAAFGTSKQAASKLIDILVTRGYVERSPDEEDRRRTVLLLTDRGKLAAKEIKAAVESVDRELEERLGSKETAQMRTSLGALVEIAEAKPGR
jgi:DNA-binding MarR family transcriptional regulator